MNATTLATFGQGAKEFHLRPSNKET